MSRPRVSVLLPVRDEERYLAECLESLSAQTLSDLEVLVVDDGSTDASAAIAEEHARHDPRFRVIRQEPAGMVAASERARTEARAPLLARMDADDVALPERLELQVRAIEEEGLAAVGGRVEYFPDPSDGMRAYADWLNSLVTVDAALRDLWVECPLPGPGLTARAEFVCYRDRGWPEDYDLVLRIWERGGRFRNVDRLIHRWRDHTERLTRTQPAYTLDAFRHCKVHLLRRTLLAAGARRGRLGRRPDRKGVRARAPRGRHAGRGLRRGRPAQARQADPRRARRPGRACGRLSGSPRARRGRGA